MAFAFSFLVYRIGILGSLVEIVEYNRHARVAVDYWIHNAQGFVVKSYISTA